jgi:uncharacterized repeat protein (TIGR01451 family)
MKTLLIVTTIFLIVFLALAVPCLADTPINVYVYENNSVPVGGASVVVLVNGDSINAVTQPDGMASFTLPNGTYTFTAVKDGYLEQSVPATVGVDNNITITIQQLFAVSGTIVDAATGLPLSNASVTVTNLVTQDYYTGATDSNGIFTVQVPNGYYNVLVRVPNYETTTRDNDGAGYQVNDNSVYVGYIPVPALNGETGNPEGVQLTSDFPGMTVNVNQSVSFNVNIANNGEVAKTYELAVTNAPPGWNVNFLSGSNEVNRVYVPSQGTETFQVQTTPLTPGNNSVITIMAASGADNASLQLYVTTANATNYSMELSCPNNTSLNVGDTTDLDVVVKNYGSTPLTNVMVDIPSSDVPSTLSASVSSPTLAELDPGDSADYTVSVTANSNDNPGTADLYMSASSDQTTTGQEHVAVTLVKSNTWIGVGIGIALVAILAFGFIVWKYGRR